MVKICINIQVVLKQQLNQEQFHRIPKTALLVQNTMGDYQPLNVLLKVSSHCYAQHMTMIDIQLFTSINFREFLGQNWNKEDRKISSYNITTAIQHLNSISYYVASCILLQEKLQYRIEVLKRWIEIADELLEIHNYNSFMGIMNGLSLLPVSRLKFTFSGLSKHYVEKLRQLEKIQNPRQKFINLRTKMDLAGPYAIPYLAVYLQDIASIEECIPTFYESEKYQINLEKFKSLSDTMGQILNRNYKNWDNIFSLHDSLIRFLRELPYYSEEDLYDISLIREPKEITQSAIK